MTDTTSVSTPGDAGRPSPGQAPKHRQAFVDHGEGVVELTEFGEQRLSPGGQPLPVADEVGLFGGRGAEEAAGGVGEGHAHDGARSTGPDESPMCAGCS